MITGLCDGGALLNSSNVCLWVVVSLQGESGLRISVQGSAQPHSGNGVLHMLCQSTQGLGIVDLEFPSLYAKWRPFCAMNYT